MSPEEKQQLIIESMATSDLNKMFEAVVKISFADESPEAIDKLEIMFMTAAVMTRDTILQAMTFGTSPEETTRVLNTVGKSLDDFHQKYIAKKIGKLIFDTITEHVTPPSSKPYCPNPSDN